MKEGYTWVANKVKCAKAQNELRIAREVKNDWEKVYLAMSKAREIKQKTRATQVIYTVIYNLPGYDNAIH